jgi:hypothetical protein
MLMSLAATHAPDSASPAKSRTSLAHRDPRSSKAGKRGRTESPGASDRPARRSPAGSARPAPGSPTVPAHW